MKGKNKEQQNNNQLTFPDVTPIDLKTCPRYTSILNRADGEGVGIEEMDYLQMEIESLLVNIMQRSRQLKLETIVLDSDACKSDSFVINVSNTSNSLQKSASLLTNSPSTSSDLNKLHKKYKSFNGKPATSTLPTISSSSSLLLSATSNSISKNQLLANNSQTPIVRNDIPDLFWQSVEPYCADITEDDIKLLENQIELNDRYLALNKIGPLGKHYSLQWADEDLMNQVKEGAKFTDLDHTLKLQPSTPLKRKATTSTSDLLNESKAMTKQLIDESLNKITTKSSTKANSKDSGLNYGPLTQRLISALIEQNLMTPFDSEIADYLDKIGPPQPMFMSPKTMAKKLNFNQPANCLEKKIKKTLIEQGILDQEDSNNQSDMMQTNVKVENDVESTGHTNGSQQEEVIAKDDEIANEIKNLQNELKVVTKQCKQTLVNLMSISKQNLMKQEVKKKIKQIDADIIEMYEKFRQTRLAKKQVTKKDKDKATKLIRDRQALRVQLNQAKE